MDWKQEMIKRLDALADKLGTTAAYLWSVLVKQAWLNGIDDLMAVGFLTVLAITFFRYSNKCFVKAKKGDDSYYVGAYILRVAMFIAIGIAIACFSDGIQHFINPAYFALHEVLETLEK
jgi:hypothetical protein